MMIEYIKAFLDLARKTEDPGELYHCLLVLKTTEGYMNEAQWQLYTLLKERQDAEVKARREQSRHPLDCAKCRE